MGNREKILIIDDSSVQADMLRSILEGDYDVTVAHTAESGLHYARVGDFALMLVDAAQAAGGGGHQSCPGDPDHQPGGGGV